MAAAASASAIAASNAAARAGEASLSQWGPRSALNTCVEVADANDWTSLLDGEFSADGSTFVVGDVDGRITVFATRCDPGLAEAPFFQYLRCGVRAVVCGIVRGVL